MIFITIVTSFYVHMSLNYGGSPITILLTLKDTHRKFVMLLEKEKEELTYPSFIQVSC